MLFVLPNINKCYLLVCVILFNLDLHSSQN